MVEAARSKIDDLDFRHSWMLQQDVFRLQITMYDVKLLQKTQSLQQLACKALDHNQT